LVLIGGGRVASHADPIPMADFVEMVPAAASAPIAGPGPRPDARANLLAVHPWLHSYFHPSGTARPLHYTVGHDSEQLETERPSASDLNEGQVESVPPPSELTAGRGQEGHNEITHIRSGAPPTTGLFPFAASLANVGHRLME
jgi:hypothetical protein